MMTWPSYERCLESARSWFEDAARKGWRPEQGLGYAMDEMDVDARHDEREFVLVLVAVLATAVDAGVSLRASDPFFEDLRMQVRRLPGGVGALERMGIASESRHRLAADIERVREAVGLQDGK